MITPTNADELVATLLALRLWAREEGISFLGALGKSYIQYLGQIEIVVPPAENVQ